MSWIGRFAFLFLAVSIMIFDAGLAQETMPPRQVVLQLKWKHQFQFAGFYAAKKMGYYADLGFDVEFREKDHATDVRTEVLEGRAHFGVLNSELLLMHSQGDPVVVLAAVFQHSPMSLLVRNDVGVRSMADLAGKRIMLVDGPDSAEIMAVLMNYGITRQDFDFIPHEYRHSVLQDGTVDAMSAYYSDRPFFGEVEDREFTLFRPILYGVDFYGDCFFTRASLVHDDPELVRGFREASLRGWSYALEHPEEIAELILEEYQSERSYDQLINEATAMRELILPVLVEIGHMNPARWRHIGAVYQGLGMMDRQPSLDGFIYDPDPPLDYAWVYWLAGVLLFVLMGGVAVAIWNVTLRRIVRDQTRTLAASETRYRGIVEDQTELICRNLPDGTLTFVNEAYCRYFDQTWEDLVGHKFMPIIPREDRAAVERHLASLGPENPLLSHEHRVVDGEGRIRWNAWTNRVTMDERGQVKEIQGCGRDITDWVEAEEDKRRLGEQLLQSQKMEAVGQLAGGVAHDFNNLLTAILGNVELMRDAKGGSVPIDRWRVELDQIQLAGTRAAELTRQLLAFSRKDRPRTEVLSPAELVENSRLIIKRLLRENIDLVIAVEDGLPNIDADRTQIEQVLLNLVVNAQDAMPDGGHLRISLSCCDLDRKDLGDQALPGPYVLLEVADDGLGMSEETQQRLFEPFFTTKEVGKGTGLGLATVYGIVQPLGGFIKVESRPGKGSTFRLFIPASKTETPTPGRLTEPVEAGDQVAGLILLCEDEELVRRMTKDVLGRLGYEILEAANGKEALALMERERPDLDLLITDVVMPELSGPQLVQELRRTNPDLLVLFVSGYAPEELDLAGVPSSDFLQKPYSPRTLQQRAAALLSSRAR